MIAYEDNTAQVMVSLTKKQSALVDWNKFLKERKNDYKKIAKNEVIRIVYTGHKENPKYKRSKDTIMSVDTDIPEKNTLRVFLNPALATRNKRFPGLQSYAYLMGKAEAGFRYYPAFVRRGIFFKKRGEPRDFLASWHDKIGKLFKEDVNKEIKKALKR